MFTLTQRQTTMDIYFISCQVLSGLISGVVRPTQ